MRRRKIILLTEAYQKAAEHFYQTLITLGYRKESSVAGRYSLEDFLYFLEQEHIILEGMDIQPAHIQSYYEHLQQRPNERRAGGLHPRSIYHRLRYIHHFFDQQSREGLITQNPFDSWVYTYPNQPYPSRQVLTQEQIQQLYLCTQTHYEKAILSLAYGCGLRAGEIQQLNIEDIHFRNRVLTVKAGKGNKTRTIPLALAVCEHLENYYFEERIYVDTSEKEAFLINQRRCRFQQTNGNYLLKALVKRTRNPEIIQKQISLHHLRHSIATHLLEQGMSLEKVRDFLGHYHIETTEIYTHISQKQLNRVVHEHLKDELIRE